MNVVTRTGKEYPSDYFVEHQPSHSIYFRVQDVDLEIAETIFSDADETSIIRHGDNRYDGFTNLDFISDEGDGIKVRLIHGQL